MLTQDPLSALLADDDPMACLVIEQILAARGYAVTRADDGEQAIARASEKRFDLVVLDVSMPRVDGYQACAGIRAQAGYESTPILMSTGLTDTASIARAFAAGASEFVAKPLNVALFTHRIRFLEQTQRTSRDMRLLSRVIDATHEGMLVLDARLRPLRVNAAFTRLTGRTLEQMRSRGPALVESELLVQIQQGLSSSDYWQGERSDSRAGGTIYQWVSVNRLRDLSGRTTHYVVMVTDVTALKASESKISFLARHDTLTGLPNRDALFSHIHELINAAGDSGSQVSVLSIDLDRFKIVNESLGHQFGDRLLKTVVGRLRTALPGGALLGRLGGDEFMIVIAGKHALSHAQTCAQRILDLLADPVRLDQFEFVIGASIGLCAFPDHGTTLETIIKHADTAMFRAKETGRARYAVYDEAMSAEIDQRMALEAELRLALIRGQLQPYFQPQFNLDDGRMIGAEVLLRWFHPSMGMISPNRFIPIAEETGLIVEIGQWVLEQALAQLARWDLDGTPLGYIAVNVSGPQIWQTDFAGRVREALQRHRIAPARLHLELTETLIMSDATHVETLRRLDALRELGLTLAIDDFGTGHSSLSHLKRLPVSVLKIDQSFVRDIASDSDDEAIVRAIIALARALKLDVIAEGIETTAQRDFLSAEGCHVGQGFLMARPMPGKALSILLREPERARVKSDVHD